MTVRASDQRQIVQPFLTLWIQIIPRPIGWLVVNASPWSHFVACELVQNLRRFLSLELFDHLTVTPDNLGLGPQRVGHLLNIVRE